MQFSFFKARANFGTRSIQSEVGVMSFWRGQVPNIHLASSPTYVSPACIILTSSDPSAKAGKNISADPFFGWAATPFADEWTKDVDPPSSLGTLFKYTRHCTSLCPPPAR